jgi:hypothetical protein
MTKLPQPPSPLATKAEWLAFHLAVIAIHKASGGI